MHCPCCRGNAGLALQDSLGGNARTTLIVAVADAAESAQETLDSLTFGEHLS